MDAIDADPAVRPGVPMEKEPPAALPGAHQPPSRVSSSALPPRRASGLVRRMAYAVPEHQAKRWMMLFAADRLDRLEHALGRALLLPLYAGAALAGVAFARRRLARAC